jgi:hypothetical protein
VGRAVRAVHTSCRVPPASSSRHRRSAVDGLRGVDSTSGPLASGDPHVPPCVWRDHGDALGRHHDPRSSHRWHSDLWADVSRGWRDVVRAAVGIRPPPPDVPTNQKDKKPSGLHSGWLIANFDTFPEDAIF